MNLIDALKVQHGVILSQLDYLEKLRNKKSGTKSCCLKIALKTIADTVYRHSRIEEKYLFPEMESALGDKMSTSAVMKFEHAEILKILGVLEKTDSSQMVALEAAKFTVFLRDHIGKEEKVLFPSAVRVLGEKRLKELLLRARI